MAPPYVPGKSAQAALSAATVEVFDLEDDYAIISILTDGSSEAYVLVDPGASDPTTDLSTSPLGTVVLPAVVCETWVKSPGGSTSAVKVISAGTPTITVQGWRA